MSYVPPIGSAVEFQFPLTGYTPPLGGAVHFDFNTGATGVALGDFPFDGEAVGRMVVVGVASCDFVFSGEVVGYHSATIQTGGALGYTVLYGEATGVVIHPVSGAAFGELLTGEALGVVGVRGLAYGNLPFTGAVLGVRGALGFCEGVFKLSGESIAVRGNSGAAEGALILDGEQFGSAHRLVQGVGSGSVRFFGNAYGHAPYTLDDSDFLYVKAKHNRIEARL